MSFRKTSFRLAKAQVQDKQGCCCGCGSKPCAPVQIHGINGIAYKNERTTLMMIGENFNFALHDAGLIVEGLETYKVLNDNMIVFTLIPTTDRVWVKLKGACGDPATIEFDALALPDIPPTTGTAAKVPYLQLSGHKKGWIGKAPWTVLFKDITTNALSSHFFVVNGVDEHGATGNYGIRVKKDGQYRLVAHDCLDSTSPAPMNYVQVMVNGVSKWNQPSYSRADNSVNIFLDLKVNDVVNIRYVGITDTRTMSLLITHPRASTNENAPTDGKTGGFLRLEYCGA